MIHSSRGVHLRPIAAIIATSVLCQIVQVGAAVPLLSLVLYRKGHDSSIIGVFAALPWAAVLSMGFFLPRVTSALGAPRVLYAGIGISVLALAAFPSTDSLAVWFVLNFAFGCGLAMRWIVCDMWITCAAPDEIRGRVVGLHETLSGGAVAAGPILLALFSDAVLMPFLFLIGILLAAALPPIGVLSSAPSTTQERHTLFLLQVLRDSPSVICAAFIGGVIESSIFAVLPLYGLNCGMSELSATFMLAAVGSGNVALQFGLGWLADRAERGRIHLACGMAVLLGAVAVPFTMHIMGVGWMLLFLWGGMVAGLYTLSIIRVGQRYSSRRLADAITSIALAYTAGGTIGPAVAGTAAELWQPHGFILSLALAAALFVAVALLDLRRPSLTHAP